MKINKYNFKELDINQINNINYTDGYETDLNIFFLEKNKYFSLAKFYARCIKKYYYDFLKNSANEAELEYQNLMKLSNFQNIKYESVISKIKNCFLLTNKNMNIDEEIKVLNISERSKFYILIDDYDLFVSIVENKDKVYCLMGSF